MREFVNHYFIEFNTVSVFLRLVLTLLLSGLVGYERERHGHAAGFRTHILVGLGASMTMMTGLYVSEALSVGGDPLRIAAQVVSGIGFMGAGTIMVTNRRVVRGLTTAAGLWSTAAIGLAVGCGFYVGAVMCTLIVLLVMSGLKNIDRRLFFKKPALNIYFEITGPEAINSVIKKLETMALQPSLVSVKPPLSGHSPSIGIECTVSSPVRRTSDEIIALITSCDEVIFALEMER